jgi:sugar O-acyltransferase (sialic acid O-acetyltransferase NeuD family)
MNHKEEIILIGGGGHCKACIDIIEEEDRYSIKGIIDTPEKIGLTILGYPIIESDENLKKVTNKYRNFLITIGFVQSPLQRNKLFNQIAELGGRFPVIVSPESYVSNFAKIEQGTIIMHGAIVNAESHIGKNCIINSQALLEHDVKISDYSHISTGAKINGGCRIGKNCFIGSGAIINQGIRIHENVIIGSGSVVTKDIIEPGIYAGNLLKKIK